MWTKWSAHEQKQPSLLNFTFQQVSIQSVQEVKVLGFCQVLYSTG